MNEMTECQFQSPIERPIPYLLGGNVISKEKQSIRKELKIASNQRLMQKRKGFQLLSNAGFQVYRNRWYRQSATATKSPLTNLKLLS